MNMPLRLSFRALRESAVADERESRNPYTPKDLP